jgi:hypothetical protein
MKFLKHIHYEIVCIVVVTIIVIFLSSSPRVTNGKKALGGLCPTDCFDSMWHMCADSNSAMKKGLHCSRETEHCYRDPDGELACEPDCEPSNCYSSTLCVPTPCEICR